ncbi:hypothetical protein LPJ66_000362 [Kickxella alabastrina]|uniref:Uncharacterized protein n=1 Tax=Kickxella alabastrina TaxID=61397 RepID=A0ACC1IWJ7_9FUNG|nr:hypothetical protein LPJ66_000362 [Kickxella alabastrina]
MNHVKTEQHSLWELRGDHSAYSVATTQEQPAQQHTASSNKHVSSVAPTPSIAASSAEVNSNPNVNTNMSVETASMPYKALGQPMSVRNSAIAGSIPMAYNAPSMMFNPNSLVVSSATIVAALTTGMGSTLPSMSSMSEFATAANTPSGNNLSTQSSPALAHSSMLNHGHGSPLGMLSTSMYPSMPSIPSMSTMLPMPISRDEMLMNVRTNPGLSTMNSELSIDTRHQVLHSKSSNASLGGNGMSSCSENGFNSGDNTVYGSVINGSPGIIKSDPQLFPSLLHRICEDRSMDNIAFWDESNYVCIPAMETLRLQLNNMGMTANHTDSLQKNFNDYQFFRRTDQRRIRHTSEQGIVKFSNVNFLPGREDLLHMVVRKSALKKLQNGVARASGTPAKGKKVKPASTRQGGVRAQRQSTSERLNPYSRYASADSRHVNGFAMPITPGASFPSQHPPNNLYSGAADSAGLQMPMGVMQPAFGLPPSMSVMDRADPSMISQPNQPYPNSSFTFEQNPSGFVLPSILSQQQMQLSPSAQNQYTSPLAVPQQMQPQQYQEQYSYPQQHEYHHPQEFQAQYHVFAPAGEIPPTRNAIYYGDNTNNQMA